MKWLGKINFDNRPQYDADGLITEAEVDTISGSLNTKISAKPDTLLELSDTPAAYSTGLYLKSTTSGTEWATASGGGGTSNHSELNELDYVSAGHTGFQPAGDYATDSELTSVSGALQTNIDGKSDTTHLHDDRYYTESEVDTISGSLNTKIDGKADTVHTHDDRYYTETELNNGQLDTRYYTESEIDTISGSLQTNIDGKSDTTHIHDDRYYTETEIDDIITTISGKLDDHNELNNLDYASSGHTGFQPAGDYVTDSELISVSGVLQTNINGKSDMSHIHDDRYYIESEVDTISGSLNTKIVAKPDTLLELSDTPSVYDDNKYLKSTTSGVEWATVSGGTGSSDHSELSNLDYASAGHTGQLTVGEYDIKFDSLLSANGKYSGKTFDGILGATLTYGDLVYLNTVSQKWVAADADAEATSGDVELAIVLAGGDDTDTRLLLSKGFVRNDTWNFTSYGQALYVSTTAGDMTQDVLGYTAGDIVRVVGHASTFADQIKFNPDGIWLELTASGIDHSTLGSLDYASAGHTGFAEASHSHTESDISDLDKYTESEVDTISGTLSSEIDSDISTHTSNADAHHSESHTVVSHSDTTATGANLNELVGSGDTTLHKHDTLYYTETEIDTISGSLNTKIDGKIANVSEDASPELGGQLGVGELDIKYDALLSADGKYSGSTRDGVLGATLAYGDLVYLNTTDQRWELADADAETTSGDVDLAIVLAAGNDGDTRLLLIGGYVREDDWNFTSYGQALYVSTTAGDMTQTVVSGSGDIVRTVGKAGTTADQIHFKPSESWVELS